MTNKERQVKLDKIKYEASEEEHEDLSGKMFYCDFCAEANNNETCAATQEERESKCLCAKAYNRGKSNVKKRNV